MKIILGITVETKANLIAIFLHQSLKPHSRYNVPKKIGNRSGIRFFKKMIATYLTMQKRLILALYTVKSNETNLVPLETHKPCLSSSIIFNDSIFDEAKSWNNFQIKFYYNFAYILALSKHWFSEIVSKVAQFQKLFSILFHLQNKCKKLVSWYVQVNEQ